VFQSSTKEATKLREMSELKNTARAGGTTTSGERSAHACDDTASASRLKHQWGRLQVKRGKKIVKFINTAMMFMSECDIYFFLHYYLHKEMFTHCHARLLPVQALALLRFVLMSS